MPLQRINFPSDPADGAYYDDPSTGYRWRYSDPKKRWSLTPVQALTQVATYSDTPPGPLLRNLPWFDTSDGTLSVWSEDAQAWIVASGSGNDGEDLTSTAEVVNIAATAYTVAEADIDKYLRFTADSPKTASIPPITATVGNLLSFRNVGAGDLTIVSLPELAVTFNAFSGGLVLAPKTSAQLIYVGENEWDLL